MTSRPAPPASAPRRFPVLTSALALVAVACAGGCDGDESAGADLDAAAAVDSDAEVAATDLVPPVGSAATLDVACWNLREFPSTADSPRLVGDLIASLGLDLVAVEEVGSRAALDALVARLPGWSATLPTDRGSASGGIGLLWRTEVATAGVVEAILADDAAFPRPVVRAVFTISGPGPATLELHIVHLKAGTDPSDEHTRVDAVAALEAEVHARLDAEAAAPILILGDFNEDSDDPRSAEVFAPFTAAPERYAMLSQPLDVAGAITFLPAGIMLDQMVASRGLDEAATEAPLIPPLADQLPGYQADVSDHLPLVVRLH